MPLLPLYTTMRGSRGIADIDFPSISRAMVAGISFAIVGNILISFALNLQKLAHARLDKARAERRYASGLEAIQEEDDVNQSDEALGVDVQYGLSLPPELEREARVWNRNSSEISLPLGLETDPLRALPVTASMGPPLVPTYGALFPSTDGGHVDRSSGSPLRRQPGNAKQPSVALAGEHANRPAHHPLHCPSQESEYLKSKLWYAFPAFRRTARV